MFSSFKICKPDVYGYIPIWIIIPFGNWLFTLVINHLWWVISWVNYDPTYWLRVVRNWAGNFGGNYIYIYPICSMYGIFTCIWVIFRGNVGKYSIHGAYRVCLWYVGYPATNLCFDHGSSWFVCFFWRETRKILRITIFRFYSIYINVFTKDILDLRKHEPRLWVSHIPLEQRTVCELDSMAFTRRYKKP